MKKLFIVKTGAAGDVIRTSPLLTAYKDWHLSWFVDPSNRELINEKKVNCIYSNINEIDDEQEYDLVICLEEDITLLERIFNKIRYKKLFGTYVSENMKVTYTDDSANWFNMSIISKYGIEKANRLKINNRLSYQEILFQSLGIPFKDHEYILPKNIPQTDLVGEIAIAPKSGERWPMKNWFYYNDLITILSKSYKVNILPNRKSKLEHIADISQHKLIICGDSLPMHIALGLKIPTIGIFLCTSPWEIYDYGILNKIISPNLSRYFYQTGFIEAATKSIHLDEILNIIDKKISIPLL